MELKGIKNMKFVAIIILSLLYYGCDNDVIAENIAPNFTLKDLSGEKVSLKQFRGQVVLLDFWATWCPPCRRSIPELVDIQEKYKDRNLVILGISIDDPRQINNNFLKAFKNKFNINYRILRSNDRLLMDYFGTKNFGIPTMVIVGRNGLIVDKLQGFLPGAVEKSLKRLAL